MIFEKDGSFVGTDSQKDISSIDRDASPMKLSLISMTVVEKVSSSFVTLLGSVLETKATIFWVVPSTDA